MIAGTRSGSTVGKESPAAREIPPACRVGPGKRKRNPTRILFHPRCPYHGEEEGSGEGRACGVELQDAEGGRRSRPPQDLELPARRDEERQRTGGPAERGDRERVSPPGRPPRDEAGAGHEEGPV